MLLLHEQNVKQYLVEKKFLKKGESATITLLQGGNVNTILRVTTKTTAFVLKQTLEEPQNKKIFLKPLKFSMDRNYYEIKIMETIHALLSEPNVPTVLFTDAENFVIGMTAVPEDAKLHQQELFEGKFHFDVAYALGKFTAELHSKTWQNKEIEKLFSNSPGLDIRAATIIPSFQKFPHHKKKFQEAFLKSRINTFCLVDADITQKNILLHDGTFTKLDFETVHLGDPALDVGIMIAHYFLPAFVYPQWKQEYLLCAALYWQGYQAALTFKMPKNFFINMKNYCAMMMIGRIDSDVVLPWLDGHHDEIRDVALGIFDTESKNIELLLSFVEKWI